MGSATHTSDAIVLGIESSCDETAVALVRGDRTIIAQAIAMKGLSVRQAESLARRGMEPRERKPRARSAGMEQLTQAASFKQSGPKDPDVVALEVTLSESLGMTVTINDRGPSGDIVISYESLTQLDEVLRRLGGGM